MYLKTTGDSYLLFSIIFISQLSFWPSFLVFAVICFLAVSRNWLQLSTKCRQLKILYYLFTSINKYLLQIILLSFYNLQYKIYNSNISPSPPWLQGFLFWEQSPIPVATFAGYQAIPAVV
jgi:hypothetical protein